MFPWSPASEHRVAQRPFLPVCPSLSQERVLGRLERARRDLQRCIRAQMPHVYVSRRALQEVRPDHHARRLSARPELIPCPPLRQVLDFVKVPGEEAGGASSSASPLMVRRSCLPCPLLPALPLRRLCPLLPALQSPFSPHRASRLGRSPGLDDAESTASPSVLHQTHFADLAADTPPSATHSAGSSSAAMTAAR